MLDRVRGRVLQAFVEAAPTAKPSRFERPARRGLALALTASLGLAVVGTAAAAAAPGRPFYPLKLSIESAALPAVDAPTGWIARIDRLGARMDEALGAEADRDSTGIAAALGEYRLELAGLVVAPLDPPRRAQLQARAGTDLPTVVALDGAFPSQVGGLLIVDLRALLPVPPASPDSGGLTGNPHQDGATGNPHADGTTGNPHADGTTGNPHADGTTGDPHAGTTGNPHTGGTTSNPHPGTTGNPHAGPDRQSARRRHDQQSARRVEERQRAFGRGEERQPARDGVELGASGTGAAWTPRGRFLPGVRHARIRPADLPDR